jgi:hypothetical protein
VNVVRTSPLLAVTTMTTCAVVVRFGVELWEVVVGVVVEVEDVVEGVEDEEDVDELLEDELLEGEDDDDEELEEVVDEVLLTLVVVGVVDAVEILLLVVVEFEVVLVDVRFAVRLLNLGSPLDNEIVTRTVLTPSSPIIN